MRPAKLLASCLFGATLLVLVPQTRSLAASAPAAAQSSKQDKNGRPQPVRDGDTVFRQNCSRCHNAPETFPHQITTAVVRHMRVRANLSEEDARALLKFFNP
jgi:cytochrome c5